MNLNDIRNHNGKVRTIILKGDSENTITGMVDYQPEFGDGIVHVALEDGTVVEIDPDSIAAISYQP